MRVYHWNVLCGDDFRRPICGKGWTLGVDGDDHAPALECVTCTDCLVQIAKHFIAGGTLEGLL